MDIFPDVGAENMAAADSDGTADAMLQEGAVMKRHRLKEAASSIIQIESDSSNDDCEIVYSVLGTTVIRTGWQFHPPILSIANIVVKKEKIEMGAPGSPTLWGDYIGPEDANHAHDVYVRNRNVYTPATVVHSVVDIASCSNVNNADKE